jgi:hypothetical protein
MQCFESNLAKMRRIAQKLTIAPASGGSAGGKRSGTENTGGVYTGEKYIIIQYVPCRFALDFRRKIQ